MSADMWTASQLPAEPVARTAHHLLSSQVRASVEEKMKRVCLLLIVCMFSMVALAQHAHLAPLPQGRVVRATPAPQGDNTGAAPAILCKPPCATPPPEDVQPQPHATPAPQDDNTGAPLDMHPCSPCPTPGPGHRHSPQAHVTPGPDDSQPSVRLTPPPDDSQVSMPVTPPPDQFQPVADSKPLPCRWPDCGNIPPPKGSNTSAVRPVSQNLLGLTNV